MIEIVNLCVLSNYDTENTKKDTKCNKTHIDISNLHPE